LEVFDKINSLTPQQMRFVPLSTLSEVGVFVTEEQKSLLNHGQLMKINTNIMRLAPYCIDYLKRNL
jgi:hypothetical protein